MLEARRKVGGWATIYPDHWVHFRLHPTDGVQNEARSQVYTIGAGDPGSVIIFGTYPRVRSIQHFVLCQTTPVKRWCRETVFSLSKYTGIRQRADDAKRL